jgi:tetratricopeptide (TPR) repeat protein
MNKNSIEELENIISVSKNHETRVQALLELSQRYSHSDLMRSWLLARDAERDAEMIDDSTMAAKANVQSGNALWKLADYVNAQKHFMRAVELFESMEDHDGMANAFCGLGIVHGELKDYPQALEYFERALHESERVGNRKRAATQRGNIGSVLQQIEKYDEALLNFHQALEVFEELDDKPGIANMINGIAGVKVYQGKFDEAETYLERHREINIAEVNHYGIAVGYMNYGILNHKKSDYRMAVHYLEKAMLYAESEKVRSIKYKLHKCFGELYTDMGKSDKALEHYKRIFEIEKEIKAKEIKQKTEIFERRRATENGGEKNVA